MENDFDQDYLNRQKLIDTTIARMRQLVHAISYCNHYLSGLHGDINPDKFMYICNEIREEFVMELDEYDSTDTNQQGLLIRIIRKHKRKYKKELLKLCKESTFY